MASNRCPDCLTDWPLISNYEVCPRCRIPTGLVTNATAMIHTDAKKEINRIEFDRFYSKHEEKRAKRGDPSPEQIGAFEAKEIAKLERDIKA